MKLGKAIIAGAAAGLLVLGGYSVLAENNDSGYGYGPYCGGPAYSQGRGYGCGGYRGGCGYYRDGAAYSRDSRSDGPYCYGPYVNR